MWINDDVEFEFGGNSVHVAPGEDFDLPDGADGYLKQVFPDLN